MITTFGIQLKLRRGFRSEETGHRLTRIGADKTERAEHRLKSSPQSPPMGERKERQAREVNSGGNWR